MKDSKGYKYSLSDDDLKILKKSIEYVKKMDIYKQNKEKNKSSIKKAA